MARHVAVFATISYGNSGLAARAGAERVPVDRAACADRRGCAMAAASIAGGRPRAQRPFATGNRGKMYE